MVPTLNVTPEARDIVFRDSCNCCIPARFNPNMRVYVNSQGQVVEFDKNKATNESEAIVRSIDNLAKIVSRMIEDRDIERQETLHEISTKLQSVQQTNACLTREMVEDIVYQIQSSPKRRK